MLLCCNDRRPTRNPICYMYGHVRVYLFLGNVVYVYLFFAGTGRGSAFRMQYAFQ